MENTVNQNSAREQKQNIKLSQCMIVKNEEKNIERALSWARDIAFEKIVVDTGSTDATVEIAERMGAKIYHFNWINDFAAAKNYAIEQASGDWIAFLDADEYFMPEDAKKLMEVLEAIEKHPNGAEYEIVNNALVQLDDDDKPFSVFDQQRIFRNKPGIRYANKIHEYLQFSGLEFNARNLSIIHTGYAKKALEEKGGRNRAILQELFEENPDNVSYMVYMANELKNSDRQEDRAEAERLYRLALANGERMITPTRLLLYDYYLRELIIADGRADDALALCEEAISYFPDNVDYLYYYGVIQNEKKNFETAWDALRKCEIEFSKEGFIRTSIADSFDIRLYYALAVAAQGLGDTQSQTKYLALILKSDNQQKGILIPYIRLLKRQGLSDEELISILQGFYNFNNVKDKLFIARAAKDADVISLAQAAMDMITPRERQWLSGGQ